MTKSNTSVNSPEAAHTKIGSSDTPSKVYLVGAGPGAADLITVRGAKLLAQADIVFHDALVDPEMLLLCPQAQLVAVGKRCGKLSSAQQFINKRLVDAAQKYQIIVRLKGGDPMLFGRADEEIQALKAAGIAVEVVPGVTAALASAASIQQSLTLRGISRSVAFVTLAQATENAPTANSKQPTTQKIAQPFSQPIAQPNADTLWCTTWVAKMLPKLRSNSLAPTRIITKIRRCRSWKQFQLNVSAYGLAL